MEKIPSIDIEYIRDLVRKYTEGELKHSYDGKIPMDGALVNSVEEYVALYTENDRPVSYEEVARTMTILLESGCLKEDGRQLARLLIDNPRYSRKMVLVFDGSYRNNRIWFNGANLYIECYRAYDKRDYVSFTGKSIKYQLNWLWNHYDVIYFQVPLFSSIDDVLKRAINDD